MAQQARRTPATPSATATMTTTASQTDRQLPIRIPASGTLRLRAEPGPSQAQAQAQAPERRVQWAEGVVNNEGMGKKSSKVCCIYHKPRPAGESSDEDSSDSSSDDSESDSEGAASPQGKRRQKPDGHHNHDGECAHGHEPKAKRRTPNAYEQVPKNK